MQLRGPHGEMVKVGPVSFDVDEERPAAMYIIPLLWNARGSLVME